MSASLPVGGALGPRKTSLLRISNRHAMHDANLLRKVTAYHRHYIITMANLEFETKEIKDFLRRLYHCESNRDPLARR